MVSATAARRASANRTSGFLSIGTETEFGLESIRFKY